MIYGLYNVLCDLDKKKLEVFNPQTVDAKTSVITLIKHTSVDIP